MDGVPFIAAEVAWGKAWTAATWGETSKEQGAKAAELPQFATAITVASGGRYTPQAGGIPIRRNGTVIGAAGASGLASGEVDEEILQQVVTDARLQPGTYGSCHIRATQDSDGRCQAVAHGASAKRRTCESARDGRGDHTPKQ
jgi:Haem-degrading